MPGSITREDRSQYGPLQLSLISTSLLVMLHVPPVVLLGPWCINVVLDVSLCACGFMWIRLDSGCMPLITAALFRREFRNASGSPDYKECTMQGSVRQSARMTHPIGDRRMSRCANYSLVWPLSPRASVTCLHPRVVGLPCR